MSWCRRIVLSGVVLAGLLALHAVSAQEDVSTDVAIGESSGEELSAAELAAGPVEEVIVRGQRPIGALIREGARQTEQFYDRLNLIIDNEDFRIGCENEYPSGSNIARRVCRTQFQRRLLNQQAVSIVQGLGTTEDGRPVFNDAIMDIQPRMATFVQEFNEAVLRAVNTDPVLNEQVIRLMALKSAVENYESPREQRRRERRERRAADREDD